MDVSLIKKTLFYINNFKNYFFVKVIIKETNTGCCVGCILNNNNNNLEVGDQIVAINGINAYKKNRLEIHSIIKNEIYNQKKKNSLQISLLRCVMSDDDKISKLKLFFKEKEKKKNKNNDSNNVLLANKSSNNQSIPLVHVDDDKYHPQQQQMMVNEGNNFPRDDINVKKQTKQHPLHSSVSNHGQEHHINDALYRTKQIKRSTIEVEEEIKDNHEPLDILKLRDQEEHSINEKITSNDDNKIHKVPHQQQNAMADNIAQYNDCTHKSNNNGITNITNDEKEMPSFLVDSNIYKQGHELEDKLVDARQRTDYNVLSMNSIGMDEMQSQHESCFVAEMHASNNEKKQQNEYNDDNNLLFNNNNHPFIDVIASTQQPPQQQTTLHCDTTTPFSTTATTVPKKDKLSETEKNDAYKDDTSTPIPTKSNVNNEERKFISNDISDNRNNDTTIRSVNHNGLNSDLTNRNILHPITNNGINNDSFLIDYDIAKHLSHSAQEHTDNYSLFDKNNDNDDYYYCNDNNHHDNISGDYDYYYNYNGTESLLNEKNHKTTNNDTSLSINNSKILPSSSSYTTCRSSSTTCCSSSNHTSKLISSEKTPCFSVNSISSNNKSHKKLKSNIKESATTCSKISIKNDKKKKKKKKKSKEENNISANLATINTNTTNDRILSPSQQQESSSPRKKSMKTLLSLRKERSKYHFIK